MLRKQQKSRPEVLPEGWEAKKWKKRTVYVNHATKQTQWEKPSASPLPGHVAMVDGPVRKREQSRKREDLPQGWRKVKTTEGKTLYVNDGEKLKSWDRPVVIVAPAVPPQHGSEALVDKGRRSSTRSDTPTANNNAPDDEGNRRRDIDEDRSRKARSRPSNDASQGLRGKEKPSSSGGPHSSTSSSTRHERDEEPGSPLPRGWSKEYNKRERPFYRNELDQTATWEKPTGAATRRTDTRSITSSNGDVINRPTGALPVATNLAPLSSLPAGWREALTESGEKFYPNDYDQTATWDKPTGAATSRAVAESSTSSGGDNSNRPEASIMAANLAPHSPLPAGWSEAFTESGERYYRCHFDQTTTWDRPKEAPTCRVFAGSGSSGRSGKRKGQKKSPPAKSNSGEQQGRPLPPGWSQAVTADGQVYNENHNDLTTSWDPPVIAPASPRDDVVRSKTSRRQSASGVRDAHALPLPARPDVQAHQQQQQQQQQQQPEVAAPAPAVFDPTMFGIPPGTQISPQVQQVMMQEQAMIQAAMQGQQQSGQQTGVPMSMPGMFGGSPPTTALGRGINFLAKRIAEPPTAKPPPNGYVGLNGGSFTNVGGLGASALKTPKNKKKEKRPEKQEPSSMGDIARNMVVKGLNKTIYKGLEAVGVKDFVGVEVNGDKKIGKLHYKTKMKTPGSGLGSGSDSDSDSSAEPGEEEQGVDIDSDININADVEQPEEEEEEEREEQPEDGGEEGEEEED